MNGDSIPDTYRFLAPGTNSLPSRNKFSHDSGSKSRYESLKEAIVQKDRGSIIWLLNEGCPVNPPAVSDNQDCTPLHTAVLANDVDVARILICAGAQINILNYQKQSPLHLAFEMRQNEMVDLLLTQCDGKVNPFTVYGLSHFHIACVRNNWLIANSFLQRGVNVNVYLEKCFYGRDYVYYRPLHLAVKHENLEVTELLLKYGANVNAKDRYKRTPLHLACRYNYKRICELIRTATDIVSSKDLLRLIKEEDNNQVHIVKLLARYRANFDALDANDTPPLFHVFKCDYRQIRATILEKMVIDDEEFWNEIIEIFKNVQREKFYALIQLDDNVKFCSESKDTLLHLVIDGRKLFTGYNPLASKERDLSDEEKAECIDLLCKYGADIDAKNSAGLSPLQMAIQSYRVKTVRALLNHYATVSNVCFFHYKMPKRDVGGNFDLTEMENFLDIIGMMLKRKSDLNINRSNELLMLRYMAIESNVQHFENCSTADLRHLLDFGDINSMNVSFYVSERSVLSNREKIGLVLEHIQKLEIAGLHVDENIKREFFKCGNCAGFIESDCNKAFLSKCQEDINKLKLLMVDRYASFYDLLLLNVNEVAVRVRNEEFRKSFRKNSKLNITLYNDIIIKQFVKGMVRSILLESAKEYLSFIIGVELPDPCSENALSHLKNEDLCNLALAFEK